MTLLLDCDNEIITHILEYNDSSTIIKFMRSCKYIYENIKIKRFIFPYHINDNIFKNDLFKHIEHIYFEDIILWLDDNDKMSPKYKLDKFEINLNNLVKLETIHLIDRINISSIQNIQNIKNVIYVDNVKTILKNIKLYEPNVLTKFDPNCNIKLINGETNNWILKGSNERVNKILEKDVNIIEKINFTEIDLEKMPSTTLINLPKTLIKLKLGFNFDRPFNGNLPNLTKLEFGYSFNQNINNLPPNLKYLKFGSKFNSIISNYPNNLEYLEFGDDYNQYADNLPNKLKILIFGIYFNKPLINLPNSIISIKFGKMFNSQVTRWPILLKNLELGVYFEKNILFKKNLKNLMNLSIVFNISYFDFKLLVNLRYLSIQCASSHDHLNISKCRKLKYLELDYKENVFRVPKSLEVLKLNKKTNINKFFIFGSPRVSIIYFYNNKFHKYEHRQNIKSTLLMGLKYIFS